MTEESAAPSCIFGSVSHSEAFGGGPSKVTSRYFIRGDDGELYQFDYTDIAVDGFRTVDSGERFRFYKKESDTGVPRAIMLLPCEAPSPAELLGE